MGNAYNAINKIGHRLNHTKSNPFPNMPDHSFEEYTSEGYASDVYSSVGYTLYDKSDLSDLSVPTTSLRHETDLINKLDPNIRNFIKEYDLFNPKILNNKDLSSAFIFAKLDKKELVTYTIKLVIILNFLISKVSL